MKKVEIMQEEEINLIAPLLVICENIKLLIIGPILAYIIALGVSNVSPEKYVSKATILLPGSSPTPALVSAIMKTERILDPIIAYQGFVIGESKQIARDALASQMKIQVDKYGLLQLEVTAPTALGAQELCAHLIESWLKSTEPPNQVRQDLEKKLLFAEKKLTSISTLIDRIEVEFGKSRNKLSERREGGNNLLELIELHALYSSNVDKISKELSGQSRDVIIQTPTLAFKPEKDFKAPLSALGAFLILLVFVFLRQAWRKSRANPVLE